MPDGEPEPVIELTGLLVVPLAAPEEPDPTEDPGLVGADAPPLLVVVALELQTGAVTGGVVVLCGGFVVLWAGFVPWGEFVVLLQIAVVEPVSAEVPAVSVLLASVAPADG